MKKAFFASLLLFLFSVNYTNAQLSKFVKNVKNNVQKELLGGSNSNKPQPEPASACADAILILDLGGKFKLDYSEISITYGDDGRLLIQDRTTGNYYIARDGQTQGPYIAGNPALAPLGIAREGDGGKDLYGKYSQYINKTGDKYLITFMGKKYGPYAMISNFAVSQSKEKFAATVTENVIVTEDKSKKMEAAMKKAKTDEEKMNLSIQFAQEMQADMGSSKQESFLPTFITNMPGVTFDPMKTIGGQFSGYFKYDDILLFSYDKIMDLKGKTLFPFDPGTITVDNVFINTDNSRYAIYSYGTLTFSDKSTLAEVFNPHWIKTDGKVYLAYMYYSPKRNAIMQCKILF
jgi:hypothetical protein